MIQWDMFTFTAYTGNIYVYVSVYLEQLNVYWKFEYFISKCLISQRQ